MTSLSSLDLLPAGITAPSVVLAVVCVVRVVVRVVVEVVEVDIVVVVDVVVSKIQAPCVQVPGRSPLKQEVPSTKFTAE
jgi:hypothetical protein